MPFPRPRGFLRTDSALFQLLARHNECLEDAASLPDPNVLAAEVAEDLRAAPEQIEDVPGDLEARRAVW